MKKCLPFLPLLILPILPLLPKQQTPFMKVMNARKPFVTVKFRGQLGNQLFQAATLMAIAFDNDIEPIIAKSTTFLTDSDLDINLKKVMHRLPIKPLSKKQIQNAYKEKCAQVYEPISYTPNMRISGYFMSEKYFHKYRDQIIDLFSPSNEITTYLKGKYQHLLDHPKTVGFHIRTFHQDFIKSTDKEHFYTSFPPPDFEYFEKALALFDEEALIVVFSDDIPWCKKNLTPLNRSFVFIENETHYHDFYLMSMMKHLITANSTFSWWAGYLNRNPEKIIVARTSWSTFCHIEDFALKEWVSIEGHPLPSLPHFDDISPSNFMTQ